MALVWMGLIPFTRALYRLVTSPEFVPLCIFVGFFGVRFVFHKPGNKHIFFAGVLIPAKFIG